MNPRIVGPVEGIFPFNLGAESRHERLCVSSVYGVDLPQREIDALFPRHRLLEPGGLDGLGLGERPSRS